MRLRERSGEGRSRQVERLAVARSRIEIAGGLALAARWSPSTPLAAACSASRSAEVEAGSSAASSCASSASRLTPTKRVAPRIVAVDQPGDAPRASVSRARGQEWDAQNVGVLGLDDVGHPEGRVDGEPAVAAEVREGNRRLHGHVITLRSTAVRATCSALDFRPGSSLRSLAAYRYPVARRMRTHAGR